MGSLPDPPPPFTRHSLSETGRTSAKEAPHSEIASLVQPSSYNLMERLHCGIACVKCNNLVEQLQSPNNTKSGNTTSERSLAECRNSPGQVSYDEMLPGSSEEEASTKKKLSPQKNYQTKGQEGAAKLPSGKSILHKSSSSEQLLRNTTSTSSLGNTEPSGSSLTEAKSSALHYPDEETTTNTEQETAGEQSPLYMGVIREEDQILDYWYPSLDDSRMQENKTNIQCLESSYKGKAFTNSFCSICKNRRPKFGWKRDFTYAELQAATEGFSPKYFLSEGGFGSVYRGELNGLKIAVKQQKSASSQGEKEFKYEVSVRSKARHENLVMLLGSCSEGNHRLLVYEFVCNGSLDQHLSKHARRPLSWEKRMRIAIGALHRGGLCKLQVVGALSRIIEGKTACCIRDLSPSQLDSLGSMPDSDSGDHLCHDSGGF